jgi:hypothetical protein
LYAAFKTAIFLSSISRVPFLSGFADVGTTRARYPAASSIEIE